MEYFSVSVDIFASDNIYINTLEEQACPFGLEEMDSDITVLPEIDHCMICFGREPMLLEGTLSFKLASRLRWVDDVPPETEFMDPATGQATNPVQEEAISSNNDNDSSRQEPLNWRLLLYDLSRPDFFVMPQLRRMFVLKHVFQHPLDHPTTEKMMLLVQCPSDWFGICTWCQERVDRGIFLTQQLKINPNRNDYVMEFEDVIADMQHLFVDSYSRFIPLEYWEVDEEALMQRLGDATNSNFLLTEADAALEFRRFIHTTTFTRLQASMFLVNQKGGEIGENLVEKGNSDKYGDGRHEIPKHGQDQNISEEGNEQQSSMGKGQNDSLSEQGDMEETTLVEQGKKRKCSKQEAKEEPELIDLEPEENYAEQKNTLAEQKQLPPVPVQEKVGQCALKGLKRNHSEHEGNKDHAKTEKKQQSKFPEKKSSKLLKHI